jgi:uncharacterized protein (TIGR02270 family)
MMSRPDELLRWDVLEEHLDEACFLWTQWERALTSPLYTLQELSRGDEARLKAHLNALAMGGRRASERLLVPALGEDDPERLWTASSVLLMEGEGEDVDTVLQDFTEAPEDLRPPFARALSLSQRQGLSQRLYPLLATEDPELLAATTEILAFRRAPLEALSGLSWHEAPRVRTAALRAAHALGAPVEGEALRRALQSGDLSLRVAGLTLGVTRGARDALAACSQVCEQTDEVGSNARVALALGGGPDSLQRLIGLLEVPHLRRDVLWALGFSGEVVAAEACLPWLRDADLAGVAAEAFCGITGLALEGKYRAGSAGGSGDDEESLEAPDPDSELALPVPEAVEHWWADNRKRFDGQKRYLAGRVFSREVLLQALWSAPMRRRPVLAWELAIRTEGQHQVEVRDFARMQAHQLEQAAAAHGRFRTGPFSAWMRY